VEVRAVRHDADDRDVVVEPGRGEDLPDVLALLRAQGLPLDGVADHLPTLLVARTSVGQSSASPGPSDTVRRVVGVAALELHSDGALLRSVAVDSALQGHGLGHRLTEAALQLAAAHRVQDVFLLTTTAERFFPRFGFEEIARDLVPPAVRTSVEFISACPASAVVMRRRLADRV
jgi:amino-acid N-acetyltransferase